MTERDNERDRQAEGEAGSMWGAPRGTSSRVSRITPLAEGGAKPLGAALGGLSLETFLRCRSSYPFCYFWQQTSLEIGANETED